MGPPEIMCFKFFFEEETDPEKEIELSLLFLEFGIFKETLGNMFPKDDVYLLYFLFID